MNLLPPNSTPLEKDLVELAEQRLFRHADYIGTLWNPMTCPAKLLPYLAWAMSLDVWDDEWSEATKRQVIQEAPEWHRRKGTVWSIRKVLGWFGFDNVVINEDLASLNYDGSAVYDGTFTYGDPVARFHYDVTLSKIISNATALRLRAMLDKVAPQRSELRHLDFRSITLLYDGTATYDGSFNYGAA